MDGPIQPGSGTAGDGARGDGQAAERAWRSVHGVDPGHQGALPAALSAPDDGGTDCGGPAAGQGGDSGSAARPHAKGEGAITV